MTAPTYRTTACQNLSTPDFIPLGDSPPQKENLELYHTSCEPEDIRTGIDKWQQHIFEDFMKKKEAAAKAKMFARVKNNG